MSWRSWVLVGPLMLAACGTDVTEHRDVHAASASGVLSTLRGNCDCQQTGADVTLRCTGGAGTVTLEIEQPPTEQRVVGEGLMSRFCVRTDSFADHRFFYRGHSGLDRPYRTPGTSFTSTLRPIYLDRLVLEGGAGDSTSACGEAGDSLALDVRFFCEVF